MHGFVPSAIHATFDPIALGAGLFGAILLVQVVTIGLVIHMDCFQLRGLSKTRCTATLAAYLFCADAGLASVTDWA